MPEDNKFDANSSFIKGDYRFVWLLSYDYAIVVYIAGNQRHPNLF